VNHLKELLINFDLAHLGFFQLKLAFKHYKLPQITLNYIETKGVVPSERMIKLKEASQNNSNPSNKVSDKQTSSDIDSSKGSSHTDFFL